MKIKISDIHIGQRFTDLDPNNVATLKSLIQEQGLLNPITLAKVGGRFVLVAGRHRLEAFKELGRDEIPYNLLDLGEAGNDVDWQQDMVLGAELGENMGRRSLNRHESIRHAAAYGNIVVRIEKRRKEREAKELAELTAQRQAMAKAIQETEEKARLRREADVLYQQRLRREKEVKAIEAYLEAPNTSVRNLVRKCEPEGESGVEHFHGNLTRKCSTPEGRPELPREIKTSRDAAVGLALNISAEHAKRLRNFHDALGDEFMALFASTKFDSEQSDRAFISFAKEFPVEAEKHKQKLIARAKVWKDKGDPVQRWKDDDVRWSSNEMYPWNGVHGGVKKTNNAEVKRRVIDKSRTSEEATREAVKAVVDLIHKASEALIEANNRCIVAKAELLGSKTPELRALSRRIVELRTAAMGVLVAAKHDADASVNSNVRARQSVGRADAADIIEQINDEMPKIV